MAEALNLTYRVVSNQGLQEGIGDLQAQMGTLQPGSPEYEYDELHLNYEKRELEIRQENPEINPMTQEGAKELAQIMNQDPALQAINTEIQALIDANPNASTSWGIPIV